jgi:hypothetical protein
MAALDIYTERNADGWRYLLSAAQYPVYVLEQRESGKIAGYVCAWRPDHGRGIKIAESGIRSAETALAFLRLCKQEIDGEIQLGWPQSSTLVQVGRSLGGKQAPGDQWLLRITNMVSFLSKLAPVWERRVQHSACAGLTADLCLNLFRQAYRLRFVAGRLAAVENVGFVDASMGADGGDLCIPPDAFVRLLLGYRDLDELTDDWPDIVIRPASRYLLQTLFPKRHAYFWMPYLYYGQTEPAFAREVTVA